MNATLCLPPTTVDHPAAQHPISCRRCGGMLVNEQCMDLAESASGYSFWGSRCIQCGDIIDPLILQNRLMPPRTEIAQAA